MPFECLQQALADFQPSGFRIDEHALDLRRAIAGFDQRAATDRRPISPRNEE
ncbi:hypothetical protein D3C72_2086760 [compost metagenome]